MFNIGTINFSSGVPIHFGGNTSLSSDLANVWEFESNANDSVGSNNGTVSGATNDSAYGIFNNGYRFDGVNDFISISSLSSSVKSISVWARKSSTGQYGRIMGSSGGTYYLFQLWDNGSCYCRIQSGQTLSWSQADDTNWHHYVITANGTTVKIYQDGVLKVSQASTGGFTNFDQIARYTLTNNSANLWRGDIDELYTWDKILSDGGVSVGNTATGDIADLYASGSGLFYNS